ADVRAELADDLVDLGLGQLVLLLGVGGAGEADDVRGAALAGDHAAVALVAGRGAAGVPLDGDQGPAGLDRLDQTHVVDGVRVARELEEHQVTGLRAGGVPLAALHVPVAHHHGGRRLRDEATSACVREDIANPDGAPCDAIPAVPNAELGTIHGTFDVAEMPSRLGENSRGGTHASPLPRAFIRPLLVEGAGPARWVLAMGRQRDAERLRPTWKEAGASGGLEVGD